MIKKYSIVGLFIFFIAIEGNSQALDCYKFKEGTFFYPTIPNGLSVRKNNIQKSYTNGKLTMIWKVKWISDCQYKMVCKKVLVKPFSIKKGDQIIATIISTDGNCYTTSVIYFNKENPKGIDYPNTEMCIKKD
ncbi:MAG: hypothetical protein Q8K70_10565 [Bacteroidota bacterium]|nr:hypothetical protein [Bacteroidota bacterium]